ncbi:MAG TPA: phosphatase PAP2 family protein [Gemmatimonadales bacterium]|nr:phosphatase PAP2 family protein [Gemmatimonadales bacterium]
MGVHLSTAPEPLVDDTVADSGRVATPLAPTDRVLLAYVALVSVVAMLRAPTQPGCRWLLVAHALILTLVWLVRRPGLGVVGRALREAYPLLLLPGLYAALDVLNGAGQVVAHDELVQRWELALFGGQPSRAWWRAAPSPFWSTVFHGAYFAYYLIVPLPVAYFALRGELAAVRRTVFAVVATFVVCYLWFVFFPVAGPYYAFPRPDQAVLDNPMARLVYATLATGSSYGAAFPSSHVAATVACAAAAWMGSRRLGLALVVPTALLALGVVYCQMHYAVDAAAGLVVAAVVLWTTRLLERRGGAFAGD